MPSFYASLSWRRTVPAVMAVAGSLLLSLSAAWQTHRYELDRVTAEFRLMAQNRALAVQQRIDACMERLDAVAGFLEASDSFYTRTRFQAVAHGALAATKGIQALAFAAPIAAAERAAFIEYHAWEGFPNLTITEIGPDGALRPAGERPEYFPVQFVEPLQNNQPAVGYDLASCPTRRQALERAIATKGMAATGTIKLFASTAGQKGFIVFRPVFDRYVPADTPEQRREALRGVVVGVFLISDIVEDALRSLSPEGITLTFIDRTAQEREEVYTHTPRLGGEPYPSLSTEIALSIPRRAWVMRSQATSAYVNARSGINPWVVLSVGLAMTALLGLYLHRSLAGQALAEGLAEERNRITDELRDKVEELEQAHFEVTENEEILQKILLGIRAGIIVIDPVDFRIKEVNSVAEDILGIPARELQGKPWRSLGWIDPSGAPLLEACLLDDKSWLEKELRFARPDGRVVPVIKTVVSGYRAGRLQAFEIVFDISDRKALERQLATAIKLESVGLLAAGIAHEINTPTQYIGDNLDFLKTAFTDLDRLWTLADGPAGRDPEAGPVYAAMRREVDPDYLRDEIPKALAQSMEGVERVTGIVKAMKKFSHPGTEEKTAVDINEAVQTTVTVARNEWKYVAETVTELDPDLPPAYCLPGDFNQVLLNILVNAAHAVGAKVKGTNAKGRITLRTLRDDGHVRIEIEDTGEGIPEANRSKIFDPFFTTKAVGKGTGQGLAIAHQIIVEKHGGTIDFRSEVGVGTTFVIRIPFGGPAGHEEKS